MKTDPQGRVWAGYMNDATRASAGCLYCLGPDGFRVNVDAVAVPNSLAWSPDGGTMYFADGLEPVIWAFDFDGRNGAATGRRLFARLERGIPDGAAVDVEGGLWSANYGGGKLIRFAPDGVRSVELDLPVTQPTCPAFIGEDMRALVCASANQRLSPEQLEAEPLAGELFAVRVDTPGLTVPRAKEALLPEPAGVLA
jgi:L-arabinonolactonase